MRMWAAKFKMSVANIGLMAPLWLLCTLTIPGPVQAAVYFDSNFETCAVGTGNDFPCEGWNDFGKEFINAPNHHKIEITNLRAFTGTKSVKGTYVNAVGGIDNPSIFHFYQPSAHLFARFATIQSPGFVFATNATTKMIRFHRNSGGFYPVISVWDQNDKYIIGIEGSWRLGTVNFQGGPKLSSTTWDQVELEIKLNTPGIADGLVRLWVNGTLYIERLNLELVGPTPTSINSQGILNSSDYKYDTIQYFVQAGLGNKWFDRFAVGNTRIGLATGQTSRIPRHPPHQQGFDNNNGASACCPTTMTIAIARFAQWRLRREHRFDAGVALSKLQYNYQSDCWFLDAFSKSGFPTRDGSYEFNT